MKQILKIIAGCAISLSALAIGCVNGLSLEESDSSARLNNISGIKERAALKDLVYQGGSMLYNPSDSSVSQLETGVIVATRAGMVVKTDLGNGETSFSDPVYAASFGYIEITDIDKDHVTFDYYVSDGWKPGEEIPSRKGSYTLAAGQSVDLTGDGYADLKYTTPSNKRRGAEKAMWLTVINNPSETMESFMFAIIPEQYENKTYPGGLVNINDEGRYVVTKYDMSNRGIRSAVKSLSYGDYVIDNEESCFQIYVGSSSYGKARAVSDTELNEFDLPEKNNPETYYFKPEEFAGSYSIYSLFEKIPASLVTVDYSSMTISDLTVELNKLLVKEDLWKTLVENNNSDEAVEVRKTMEELELTDNLITVVANRIVLNKLYSDDCPSFNTFGNTFSAVFQNFSFYLGEPLMDDSLNESFSAARVMASPFQSYDAALPYGHTKADFFRAMKEFNEKYSSIIEENAAAAKKRAEEELKKKEAKMKPEYVEYTHKLAKIKKEFKDGVRLSYDLGKFAKTFISNDVVKQLFSNTNFTAEVGVGGNLTILRGKFDFVVKFYTLVTFAVDDGLKYTSAGSFFTKKDPVVFKKDGTVETKDDMKEAGLTKEQMDAKIKENDKELSEAAGVNPDNLFAKIISSNRSKTRVTDAAIRLTRVTVPLGGPYPIQFWFEAKLDMLYKYVIALEYNDFYIGGAFLAGFDVGMGVDWDYLNLLFVKIPRNFRSHSNSRFVKEGAFYAGTKYQSNDDIRLGISGDVTITPVLELKPGFGLGTRVLGTEASVGIEMPVTFAFPIDTTIRYSVNPTKILDQQESLEFNTEAHFYAAVDFDVNAHLEVLCYSKDFKFPIGTVGEFDMLLGRIHAKTGEETFTEGPRVISTTFLGKTY